MKKKTDIFAYIFENINYMNKTKTFMVLLFVICCLSGYSQDKLPPLSGKNLNFILISDSGMKTEPQRLIASSAASHMSRIIEDNKISFVAVAGDPIHDNGVKDVNDPEWKFKVEDIFCSKALHSIPWHAVPGNHEYKGNPQAIVDYSKVSRRWDTPARYYSIEKKLKGTKDKVLFVFLDTSPLIKKRFESFPEKVTPDYPQREMEWFDSTMVASDARWKIVIGHQPVYASTNKGIKERLDIQETVNPVLLKHDADIYVCGHIHSFQHIIVDGCDVNYIVNSSIGRSREVGKVEGTKFCADDQGFTVFSIGKDKIDFWFISSTEGNVIYNYSISR